jgi:mannose-1-phosphate guanylyltransferase
VRELYERYSPEMWQQLCRIEETIGTSLYESTLSEVYPTLPVISFDDAILTHLDRERALVLHGVMEWSDPGSLYALKETLDPDPTGNVRKGLVIDTESTDSLIYNYEPQKLVVAVGLEGMIVVNTDDAILVVHKSNIPLVKKVIDELQDTRLESYS